MKAIKVEESAVRSAVRTCPRGRRALESYQSAAGTIGTLEHGMALFAITRGQWSSLDAILAVLDQTGPAHISVWTWRLARYDTEVLGRLLNDGRLLSARLIVDGYGTKMRPDDQDIMADWIGKHGAGSVRFLRTHAKIARVWNDDWRVLMRGSMNLNKNLRLEQFDLTEGGGDFDLIEEVEAGLPAYVDPNDNAALLRASGLDDDPGDLHGVSSIFGGVKTWGQ